MTLPNFNVPKYELKLPSTGKQITYRPYLVKEEKILMMAMESEDPKQTIRAIKEVVSACTSESELNVNKISSFDLEYIFLNLRSKSVGSIIKIKPECEHCKTTNDVELNLDKNYVSDTEKDNVLKITPTIHIKMKYPTISSIENIGNNSDETDTDRLFSLIISCIDSILTEEEAFEASQYKKEELENFIGQMNSEQFKVIQSWIEKMPTLKNDVEFVCSSCSKENSIEISGINNFFQ